MKQVLVKYKPKRRPPEVLTTPAEPPVGVLASRPDLAAEAAEHLRASKADATWLAWKHDRKVWCAWCEANRAVPMPATPETAVGFLTEQARTKATATIKRYVASIGKWHKLEGHPSPFSDARTKAILTGIINGKTVVAHRAKDAFTADMYLRSDAGVRANEIRGLRDRAVALTGLVTACRRSELCAFRIEGLVWTDAGLVATIGKSKTDQSGKGRAVAIPRNDSVPGACPVRAIYEWLLYVNEREGPLFRGFLRNWRPRKDAMNPGEVGIIVKRAALAAGCDPANYGGHALRAGYVTEARLAGLSWGDIMEQTGHRKVETAKRYDRSVRDPFRASKVADVFSAAFGKSNVSAPISHNPR